MALPVLLLAYAAGLILASYLPPSPLFAGSALGCALLWLILRKSRAHHLLLPLFLLFLGASFYHLCRTPPTDTDHVRAFAGSRKVVVQAQIETIHSRTDGRTALDVAAERIVTGEIAAPVWGRLRLYLDDSAAGLPAGAVIRFRSRLRLPRAFGTPGEFDYPRYLAARRIFATAFVADRNEIALLRRNSPPSLVTAVQNFRRSVGRLIDRQLRPDAAPIVKALAIGDKGGLSEPQRDLLARGGITHLFAVSGLHLGLVAAFLYGLGHLVYTRSERLLHFGPPRRWLPPVLLPLLGLYVLATGAALPTVRAWLMVAGATLVLLAGRRTRPLNLLAAAALMVLLVQPLALFEPAFQLSFSALLGILVLVPRWSSGLPETLPRVIRYVATLFLVTLAANLATLPWSLLHFHRLAPAGLVTNLFAVPMIGFGAVPLGLLGALLTPLWPAGAGLFFQGCGALTGFVLTLVRYVAELPFLESEMVYLPPRQWAALVVLLLALLLPRRGSRPWRATAALTACGLSLLAWPAPAGERLALTALSVGQGDAFLLSRPGGRHYLIDGGGLFSESFDVGERLVAPALGHLGVHRLEAVLLTHDHPDHRKGLIHVLRHFPVRAFWSAVPFRDLHPSLQRVLDAKGIPRVRYPRGWNLLEESPGQALALFVPDPSAANPNDRSVALYARLGDEGVLLTGDLEATGVTRLVKGSPPGPVTLAQIPHHGSWDAAPLRLVKRFRPEIALISAGFDNSFELPASQTLRALRTRGLVPHRTDLEGTLRCSTTGDGWRIRNWRRGLFR